MTTTRPSVAATTFLTLALAGSGCGSDEGETPAPPVSTASCATDNGGCDLLTTCDDTAGAVVCGDCPAGYSGSGSAGCVDLDECASGADDCSDLATCTNTPGGYTCGDCPSGYLDDGAGGCTDRDECDLGTDECAQDCTNTEGGYACSCGSGWELAPDGYGCLDVDECATDNGGCGDPTYWTCSNNQGAAATCADVDECATNNGGCGDPTYWTCTNNQGAAATCADVDECATNNGGCGDPTYWTCTNNQGAAATCADVDECATNNGGCGDPTSWTCTNNQGVAATCTDIDECTLGTHTCGAYSTCNNTSGGYSCTCDDGVEDVNGDGSLCQPFASCQDIIAADPSALDGVYWIDPTGSGAFEVFCEMTFDGGGWLAVYNLMAPPSDPSGAQAMHDSLIVNANMTGPVLPDSNSAAIYTGNAPLASYTEVVYGWAASTMDDVNRYGTYQDLAGVAGDCYLDGYCGANGAVAEMDIFPSGNTRIIYTGNNPSYPHVGLGYSGQIILWGYDNNASAYGRWGNWNDTTPCCNAGNYSDMLNPGWRYVIYIR